MISIPVAVHNDVFRWQLALFWYNHRRTYGLDAQAHAIILQRNHPWEPKIERLEWALDIPHTMCAGHFDQMPHTANLTPDNPSATLPLNIQIGLQQILPTFDDQQIIELLDCDMLHFRHYPERSIGEELYVSTIYENWHLHSLTSKRHVIAPYFENNGNYYNGGFVPIIGKVATFRRILPEWIAVHIDILQRPYDRLTHWWAGMYALQAACEKARVPMIGCDDCYVPNITPFTSAQYIGHYSTSHGLDKHRYPAVNLEQFEDNPFYDRVREWLKV